MDLGLDLDSALSMLSLWVNYIISLNATQNGDNNNTYFKEVLQRSCEITFIRDLVHYLSHNRGSHMFFLSILLQHSHCRCGYYEK